MRTIHRNTKTFLILIFLTFSSFSLKTNSMELTESISIAGKKETVNRKMTVYKEDIYYIGDLNGSPEDRVLRFEIQPDGNRAVLLADLYPKGAHGMGTELINYMMNVAVQCKSEWIYIASTGGSWGFYHKLGFRPIEKYESITFDPKLQLSMASGLNLLIPESILIKKKAELEKLKEALVILDTQYTVEPNIFLMVNGKQFVTLNKRQKVIDSLNRIFWNVEVPPQATPRKASYGTCYMAMGIEMIRRFADIQTEDIYNPKAIRILGDQLLQEEPSKISLEPTVLTPQEAVEKVAKELGTSYINTK